jgi:hypothetical protein
MRNNQNIFFGNNLFKAVVSELKKRFSQAKNVEKLFGFIGTAKWPESASNPAGHNDTIIVMIHEREIIFNLGILRYELSVTFAEVYEEHAF